METLAINSVIKDLPSAVAILDTNLCFVNHSEVWLKQFCPQYELIVGKPYAEVFPEFPEKLLEAFAYCLGDKSDENDGEKFTNSNGSTAWLKWKINAWKLDNNLVGGLIIYLEDVTEAERRKELLIKAERVARIGGWEIDMNTNTIFWTEVTKEIHEVAEDYIPNLEEGINFYKEGDHREEITRLVS
ncbi:MAG: PAS domain-containing protein, partial [Pricia sp.]|nr:PAS domain-containing protein [Pricia sp.]